MITLEDKEAERIDFIKKYVGDRWQEEFLAVDERYVKDKENIENRLINSFEALCKKAMELQKEEKKGAIKYIYFSYLRTSIKENKATYRLDAYDENWFLDNEECSTLWNADFIFSSLFKHMEELEESRKPYLKRITAMDIEKIKLIEADKYKVLTNEFIKSLVEKLIETEGYKEMNKDEEICIIAGEYMDVCETLYPEN